MKHVLEVAKRPITFTELVNLVKQFRVVTDSAVYRILYERPEFFQQVEGNLLALRKWGTLSSLL